MGIYRFQGLGLGLGACGRRKRQGYMMQGHKASGYASLLL